MICFCILNVTKLNENSELSRDYLKCCLENIFFLFLKNYFQKLFLLIFLIIFVIFSNIFYIFHKTIENN